jgi:hypothetical protein
MGWIKDRNVDVLADEARKAAEDGLPVFVTVLHSLAVATSGDLQVRLEWGRRIAAIEAEGWRLEQWSVDRDAKGNPEAFPVFRRL